MLSMMDRLWRPELSEAEALELMHRGIAEARPPARCHAYLRVALTSLAVPSTRAVREEQGVQVLGPLQRAAH